MLSERKGSTMVGYVGRSCAIEDRVGPRARLPTRLPHVIVLEFNAHPARAQLGPVNNHFNFIAQDLTPAVDRHKAYVSEGMRA